MPRVPAPDLGEATRFTRPGVGRVPGGARMLSLRLTPEEWAQLDAEVARSGEARSAVVRRGLGLATGCGTKAADPELLAGLLDAFAILRNTPGGHGHAVDAVAEAHACLSGAP